MAAALGALVPDPGVRFGRFRVLQRTDTKFAVVDDDAPIGRGTVATCDYLDQAERAARAHYELELLCTCGHAWATHAADSPHGCSGEQGCSCPTFSAAEPVIMERTR